MKRVFFVDKLIRSSSGHNLEYCKRLAPPFRAAGFETVILANTSFQGAAEPWLRPALVYNFNRAIGLNGEATMLTRLLQGWKRWLTTRRVRLFYAPLGLAICMVRDLQADRSLMRNYADLLPASMFVRLGLLILGTFALALLAVGYTWRQACKGFDALSQRSLFLRRCRYALYLATNFPWLLWRKACGTLGAARHFLLAQSNNNRLTQSLTRALVALKPKADDILFFPTSTPLELDIAVRVLTRNPALGACTWHFLFREPIVLTEGPDFVMVNRHRHLRALLMQLKTLTQGRLFLWTDTDELAAHYSALQILACRALPISLPPEMHACAPVSPRAPGAPVVFGYLGDARPEKGFGLLPDLVEQLNQAPCRDVRTAFLVQANYNLPGGLPSTRAAKSRLQAMDDCAVTLIDRPQTSAEYMATLARMDVVLLPYDSILYHAGSSGILAEALLAGRPVIVTDNTWAGRQVREAPLYNDYLDSFARRFGVTTLPLSLPCLSNTATDPALAPKIEPPRTYVRPAPSTEPPSVAAPEEICATTPRGTTTHVVARTLFKQPSLGDPLTVTLEECDAEGGVIRRRKRYFSGRHGTALAIWPLGEKTTAWRLVPRRLSADLTETAIEISCTACRVPPTMATPLAALGVVIADGTELREGAMEIARYFAHYRATAAQHALLMAQNYDPAVGVARMIAAHNAAPVA